MYWPKYSESLIKTNYNQLQVVASEIITEYIWNQDQTPKIRAKLNYAVNDSVITVLVIALTST